MRTIALLPRVITLWQKARPTTGDVVLVRTLGLSILSATRDLAVALVDVTQHVARLTEAIATLLLPHELKDHPEAEPLVRSGAAVAFNNVAFHYPGGVQVFESSTLRIQPDNGSGWSAIPAAENPACSRCCSGSTKSSRQHHDRRPGRFAGDAESLREAISVVPQDISLFHRSIMENIRYGRPNATDDEVLRAAIAARCDYREFPRGHGDHGRRSRNQGLRRAAAAHRHRARLPEGRADPAAG